MAISQSEIYDEVANAKELAMQDLREEFQDDQEWESYEDLIDECEWDTYPEI